MIEIALILLGRNHIPNCLPQYPKTISGKLICIPKAPPDLSCSDIKEKYGKSIVVVYEPNEEEDPHKFDRDRDGVGCE